MTILLLETIHPEALERLSKAGRVFVAEEADERDRLVQSEVIDAIITRGRGQVQRPLIEACTGLKVIARVGVGLDNIDVDAAREQGVMVINAPGSTTIATAEHTLMLMMALVRRLVPMTQAVVAGNWAYRRTYGGDELADKTLGIVGMGAIGQRVAMLATAFGMRVVYWSRSEKDVPYAYRSLADLLAEADIVSLHVALTPETRHLLDHDALATLKPGALLVNTARGAIIDQDALLDALNSGGLGGFAADVLDQEPPDPDNPLLGHANVILTPHTAALTANTFRKMCLRTINNLLAVLNNEPFEEACVV